MTEIEEHPILFNGEMVRVILDGRKTQTRRPVSPQPSSGVQWNPIVLNGYAGWTDGHGSPLHCPFGENGDQLWVRETWKMSSEGKHYHSGTMHLYVDYRAGRRSGWGQQQSEFAINDNLSHRAWGKVAAGRWRPSIHMPRWASRITLEVTAVRVERLQEISHDDALAEGIDPEAPYNNYATGSIYRDTFASMWDSIYAVRGYGWSTDPWVWVVEFKRASK